MKNLFQRCKVKVVKYHFIILCHFGVIEEKSQGLNLPPPSPGIDRVKHPEEDTMLRRYEVMFRNKLLSMFGMNDSAMTTISPFISLSL